MHIVFSVFENKLSVLSVNFGIVTQPHFFWLAVHSPTVNLFRVFFIIPSHLTAFQQSQPSKVPGQYPSKSCCPFSPQFDPVSERKILVISGLFQLAQIVLNPAV